MPVHLAALFLALLPMPPTPRASLGSVLQADGVARVNGVLTSDVAAELLEWVDASLETALRDTSELTEPFSEEWRRSFGEIMHPRNRHDLKLSPEAPPVREALSALLSTLEPAIAASLGEDAQLHELAALVSLPGSARQPVHPDTPMSFFDNGGGGGTDQNPAILTAFCALQDIDESMGPTLFLPATHTAAAHDEFFTYENFDLAFNAFDDEEGEEEDAAQTAKVEALLDKWGVLRGELGTGDVSLFDSRCLHAGGANTSNRRRVLFYCSFVRAELAERAADRGTLREDLRGNRALASRREWLDSPSSNAEMPREQCGGALEYPCRAHKTCSEV